MELIHVSQTSLKILSPLTKLQTLTAPSADWTAHRTYPQSNLHMLQPRAAGVKGWGLQNPHDVRKHY